jgi:hypothetical protein
MHARRRLWLVATLLVPVIVLLAGCQAGTEKPGPLPPPPPAYSGPPYFKDVPAGSGIEHTYRNGQDKGHLAIIESLGGGCALLDYDGDGLLDVVFAGGGDFDRSRKQFEDDPAHPPHLTGQPLKMYKNLGNWKFRDVTAEVGLDRPLFYTHGCAVADYDRDGWPDLLVTGWGRVVLYHNEPDGKGGRRFVDVTDKAGLTGITWGVSAAFADLDGDGFPDLYICQYADWDFVKKHPNCTYDGHTPDVCPPKQFYPLPHKLFRNQGDGTFRDVGKEAGLRLPRTKEDYEPLWQDYKQEALASGRARKAATRRLTNEKQTVSEEVLMRETPKEAEQIATTACDVLRAADRRDGEPGYGKGLGVISADFNGDGKPDLYVADDTVDNLLYVNRSSEGKILLEEIGLAAGAARTGDGLATGSMGLAVGDPLNQGRPAIYVTTYEGELHSLFLNECSGDREYFRYATQASGIGAFGQIYVGWGTDFIDLDHHGWQDIFVSNGHAIRFPKGKAKRAQTPLLLHNVAGGSLGRRYENITDRGGPYFQAVHCGRGVAFGDLDNDGQVDLVLCHLNEPAVLLKNQAPTEGRRWIGVELVGKGFRDVVGAKVQVNVGELHLTRFATGGGSYASASDPRHVFGLGAFQGDKVKVTVSWPRGEVQSWDGLAVGRYWRLTEGDKDPR